MYNQSSIQYLTIITRSWKSILTFDVFYFFDDIQWAGSSGSSSLANGAQTFQFIRNFVSLAVFFLAFSILKLS